MRSEKETFNLIIGTAKKDERIRAVYMNGSRTNPNAPKDKTWIHTFGDLLMIQEPDRNNESAGMDMDFDRSYG